MLQGCTRTFLSTHLPVLPLVFIHLIGDQNRAPNFQIYIIGKDVLCTTQFQIFPRDGLGGTVVSAILGLDFIGRTVTYLLMYLVNLVGKFKYCILVTATAQMEMFNVHKRKLWPLCGENAASKPWLKQNKPNK